MDILVTTPKGEVKTAKIEGKWVEREGGYWFRVFNFRPKVNAGDRIYFVENGAIRGHGRIFEVARSDGERCEVTGRLWRGDWVVKYDSWKWLETPIPFKGFQGIRYIDRLPKIKRKLGL